MDGEVHDIEFGLVEAVRSGNRSAFSELYRRNFAAAHGFACKLTGTAQGADDLVAEAFVKVFTRIIAGGGPTSMFRAYLLTTIRTTYYKQLARERMVDRYAEVTDSMLPADDSDPFTDRLEAQLAMKALGSLPERWRTVLVLLELERLTTAAVADLLGLRANAVAALAFRAREALRVAYVQMHVKAAAEDVCRESVNNLAALFCGRLTRGRRDRVREHLRTCDACASAATEVSELLAQLARRVPRTRPLAA
ncbi:hypothetical protein Lesp02_22940 [Lentzea sp. NBRC 105346]|uniref:sigma-70 family RNA polymerase sigma factor n=1 Tax=Lentzea sp. NBRC 105346 TaxID=3032205 RepID=UPI0024A3D232|nr:RNA polymerase sigma factor [Lentzea sp. NBRC 105346]GLZ30104.1 hypothetical protein Lesp02_22940 [Lentzea sp. NBRC 105346]